MNTKLQHLKTIISCMCLCVYSLYLGRCQLSLHSSCQWASRPLIPEPECGWCFWSYIWSLWRPDLAAAARRVPGTWTAGTLCPVGLFYLIYFTSIYLNLFIYFIFISLVFDLFYFDIDFTSIFCYFLLFSVCYLVVFTRTSYFNAF